jgi:DHA1 family inner membrane transport protein
LQLLVIRVAGDAKYLASSINISALNIGNVLGAALGGAVVASGAPLAMIGVGGASVAFCRYDPLGSQRSDGGRT